MKLADLPSESEWFRPPIFHQMVQVQDTRQYFLVCEPVLGSIFGVYWVVSETLIWTLKDKAMELLNQLKTEALAELYRRIERDEKHPEGCLADAFLWQPIFTRHEDGTITVEALDVVSIDPIWHPVATGLIDTKNLYSRPGRFIAVDDGDAPHGTGEPSGPSA